MGSNGWKISYITHMISLTTVSRAQQKLAEHTQKRRLAQGLTQQGLADRAGVPVSSLRRFEQDGAISLESFLKVHMVLETLDAIVNATAPDEQTFTSIDDVLADTRPTERKRGWRK